MTMIKNTKKGKCPFMMFDPCNEECVFYRKGFRYSEQPGVEPIPFEDCAINIIADNLEAMHNRTYMMQKEVGETKNIIALKTFVDMGIDVSKTHTETLIRQITKLVTKDNDTKMIE